MLPASLEKLEQFTAELEAADQAVCNPPLRDCPILASSCSLHRLAWRGQFSLRSSSPWQGLQPPEGGAREGLGVGATADLKETA